MIGALLLQLALAPQPRALAVDTLPSLTLAEALDRAAGLNPDYVRALGAVAEADWSEAIQVPGQCEGHAVHDLQRLEDAVGDGESVVEKQLPVGNRFAQDRRLRCGIDGPRPSDEPGVPEVQRP